MSSRMSRREFLQKASLAGAGLLLGQNLMPRVWEASANVESVNEYRRVNDLVILPDTGVLYVTSDFHTRFKDFNLWLNRTNVVDRIKNGEDVYGLILGDTIDKKPGDPEFERDGDSKIVDKLMKINDELGEMNYRLIYIRGNHEEALIDLYEMLVKQGMNAQNRMRYVKNVYRSALGAYYQQFNFIERITAEQYRFLKTLPLAVKTKNGVIGLHAGSSKKAVNLDSLANPTKDIRGDVLWDRPGTYSVNDTKRFLRRMEDAHMLVVGHTPLVYLKRKSTQKGIGIVGDEQVILATSYGALPGKKSYLVLNLNTVYENVHEFRLGKEIRRLNKRNAKKG